MFYLTWKRLFQIIVTLFFALNTINCQPNQWSRDYGYYRSRVDPNVCSSQTCRLPKCFCAGKDAPRRMDPSVLPQIVMFTFDDALNEQVFDYYNELFPMERLNPNGCPVAVTFFVSHNWTDYDMVKELYDRGHEIGSHSITHRMPQSWWRYGPAEDWEAEIQGQRENIAQKASIPEEEIRGMRAPFLDTGGDEQYKMMEKHGFEYDASFMTGPHDKSGAWPFTLDFVPSWEYCTNLNCPKERHPGIWEVPLNRWVGIDGNACSMVDACQQQPRHKGEALAYLWQNFNRHYYGNRSPFGANMHATWFKTPHHFEAMKEFVKTISEMDDVYILTVHQTLEWIRNPQTVDRVISFRPWMESCRGRPPTPRESVSSVQVENEIEEPAYPVYETEGNSPNDDLSFLEERYVPVGRTNRINEYSNAGGNQMPQYTEDNMEDEFTFLDRPRPRNRNRQRITNIPNYKEIDSTDQRPDPYTTRKDYTAIYQDYGTSIPARVNKGVDGPVEQSESDNQLPVREISKISNQDQNEHNDIKSDVIIVLENKDISETEITKPDGVEQSENTEEASVTENPTPDKQNVEKQESPKPPPQQPVRPRIRPNRPRQGGVQGRSDLQSRQRARANNSASATHPTNIIVLGTSGVLAILMYHNIALV